MTWHGGDDGAREADLVVDDQLSQCARVSCFVDICRAIKIENEVERDGCVLGYLSYRDCDFECDVVFYDTLYLEKGYGSCVVWCGQEIPWGKLYFACKIFGPHLTR